MGERIAATAMCSLLVLFLLFSTASAQEPNAAGLVVDYGDGRVSWIIVPFDEDHISGLQLLERSGLDIVTVGFGGLGAAVCQIDDTGCSVDDCRSRMCQTSDPGSPFWQFSKLGGDGEWLFVSTGASGARVLDGDIYAWSWTGIEPDLPALTMDELTERTGGYPTGTDVGDAVLRTEGGETGTADNPLDIASVVLVGAVAGVAGVLVVRARRSTRPETSDAR